jgi:two-component system sensor histidine kinase/response regulator
MNTPKPVRILVVDDEPANLQAIDAILEDFPLEIVKARSGPQALQHLLKHDFALVLLDVQMPGMSGIELAALIRERERSRHTPIIFQTASGNTNEMMFRGYLTGAVDYLIKPILPEILRAKVRTFVELAAALEKLEVEISERKRAQEEVNDLNAQLQQHNSELRAANQALEAFNYSVAHDLRSPLCHIKGFAQILTMDAGPALTMDQKRLLVRITDAAARMDKLVEGLLAFARLGRAAIQRAPVNLDQLVHATLERLQPEFAQRQVEWHIDPLPEVEGDATLLAQVFENLLSNALKYSRGRSPARITIRAVYGPDELTVSIADNGVGFDMQYADHLFGVFQRMHTSQQFEGTGIGLANVRQIVERHGGRTWAHAAPDEGAVFYFSLPLRKMHLAPPHAPHTQIPSPQPNPRPAPARDPAASPALQSNSPRTPSETVPLSPIPAFSPRAQPTIPPAPSPAPASRRGASPNLDPVRILWLEDNPHDVELVRYRLSQDGLPHDLITVSNEADYLRALGQEKFDLILSDSSIPGFDGETALQRAREQHPAKPFIFFSGSTPDDRARQQLQQAGATDFINKSRMDRLAESIRRAIRALEQDPTNRERSP